MTQLRFVGRAVAALSLPTLAGLAYLHASGAPSRYLATNAVALAIAGVWIASAPVISTVAVRRFLLAVTLVALFVPLTSGPAVGGVQRWLPLGPFTLHAGMLAIPALSVLAAEQRGSAPALLSIALFATLLQPDMASAAALTLAAIGLADATRDWRYVVVAVAGFVVALVAATQGELPAQPHADRVIGLLARTDPLAALGLLIATLAGFALVLGVPAGSMASRKALAGSFYGFAFAGLVSNYPSPLVGYGAAAILGYGIALGLLRDDVKGARPDPTLT